MIKLIVTDLDGTLMNHHRQVAGSDAAKLREAASQGIQLCMASGRMYPDMKQVMEEIALPAYGISQNGAAVYTLESEKLASSSFSPELAELLYDTVRAREFVTFICGSDESIRLPASTKQSAPYENRQMSPVLINADVARQIAAGTLGVCKFSLFGPIGELEALQGELHSKFEGHVEAVVSDRDCLDLMPAGVSKGTGLTLLLKHLGLRPEEAVCIGDSFNDLPMFAVTPHSYVMQHSHDDVKAGASRAAASVAEAVDHVLRLSRQEKQEIHGA
ncbi:Cof-type HAD-IIB family hydrolase [Paenibacillus lutrae]|uniref:Cof-type HAD-IIB family hydrolase n=1 Tax=Paenibacillus lutrae TaxID=2078573 RepID=A0A7X3FIH5_9BACL|nr:HAD family hydrolase [Paenibacillus lutrae]MVP00270.1 Cof-type HAD-IIB family hydrolase [Paenibacillus lutrae]